MILQIKLHPNSEFHVLTPVSTSIPYKCCWAEKNAFSSHKFPHDWHSLEMLQWSSFSPHMSLFSCYLNFPVKGLEATWISTPKGLKPIWTSTSAVQLASTCSLPTKAFCTLSREGLLQTWVGNVLPKDSYSKCLVAWLVVLFWEVLEALEEVGT